MAIAQRNAVEAILDPILSKSGIRGAFDAREIQIRDHVIVENTGNKNRFSDAVLDCTTTRRWTGFAALHRQASCAFTRYSSALVRANLMPLPSHTSSMDISEGPGRPYYVDLSEDLFYVSLTRPGAANEAYMWNAFAERGRGVRLKLQLTPQQADLRGIQYAQASRTLLNRINDALTWEKQPPFVPWTISRIGGFYLPSNLNVEDEVRLVIKRHKDAPKVTRSDGKYDYRPVPIGTQNPVCKVELTAIECGPNAIEADVAAAIAGTVLAGACIV